MKPPLLLLALCLVLSTGCAPLPEEVADGPDLYRVHCAACHGSEGEGGRGPALAVPRLSRASTDRSLRRVIRNGISGSEMPKLELTDGEIRKIAAWVRELGRRPAEHMTGDAKNGRQLYFTKGDCRQCHAIQGDGGALGPDLSEIGLTRSAGYLRIALTEPEADVPRSFSSVRPASRISANFLQVRVITISGLQVTGLRTNEDTFSIQIRDLSGRDHSFFKSELRELHKDWGKSPMPSYRGVFSEQELDDLVAFLASLRGTS